jgi:hypothetical protein
MVITQLAITTKDFSEIRCIWLILVIEGVLKCTNLKIFKGELINQTNYTNLT